MDLDEWEFIPRDVLLDLDKKPKKKIDTKNHDSCQRISFNNDYFVCPSPYPKKTAEPSSPSTEALPMLHQIVEVGNKCEESVEVAKETSKFHFDITIMPSQGIKYPNFGSFEADQDAAPQVFFKKMNENEFVDMKMDSPKATSPKGNVIPQIGASNLGFNEKTDGEYKSESILNKINSPRKQGSQSNLESKKHDEMETTWDEDNGGLNIWKWSLNGFGAIFSFGVAAASFCILVLSDQRIRQEEKNQKLGFKSYTDNKGRIKEVVHHATKLKEAMCRARGIHLNKAQITFGSCYNDA